MCESTWLDTNAFSVSQFYGRHMAIKLGFFTDHHYLRSWLCLHSATFDCNAMQGKKNLIFGAEKGQISRNGLL